MDAEAASAVIVVLPAPVPVQAGAQELSDEESGATEDAALSTTPSLSSDSGSASGSSLTARRTPPRLPLKRSLRAELRERWPGWSSPARKRLKSSPLGSPLRSAPGEVAGGGFLQVHAQRRTPSKVMGVNLPIPSEMCPGPGSPSTRSFYRFWKRAERVANSPISSPMATARRGEDEDCHALCQLSPPPTIASTRPRPRPRSWSPSISLPGTPGPGLDRTWARARTGTSTPTATSTLPTGHSRRVPVPEATRTATAPEASPRCGPPGTVAPSADAAPGYPESDDEVYQVLVDDDCEPTPIRLFPRPPSSEVCDERVARAVLEMLVPKPELERPRKASAPDAEDDGSVLQLLVLTPTEERKMFPVLPLPVQPPGRGRGAHLGVRSVSLESIGPWWWFTKKEIKSCVYKIKLPYFILFVGLIQVALYTLPTSITTKVSAMLVWDAHFALKEPWRFVTYSLLHSSTLHLVMNVGVQTFLALILEIEQSRFRVAGVYFGGTLVGSLATAATAPGLLMVGASAGVYAILTAHLAQIFLNPDSVKYKKTRAATVLLLAVSDIAWTTHHAWQRGNEAPRIGVTAHVAGAVGGLLLGLALFRTKPPSVQKMRHQVAQISAGILTVIFVAACSTWLFLHPP